MWLLGIYQTFMHFHLEIRVLVASSILTNAATLLADPRYIKISFHFSFMMKSANERIPFKNYIASEKSFWSHFFSCPLALSLPLSISRTISLCYYIKTWLLCLSLSLFSLSISLSFHVSFYLNIYPLALSRTLSLSHALSQTLPVCFSLSFTILISLNL